MFSVCSPVSEGRGPEHALLEPSIHNVREDFEFAVRMSSESGAGLDPVFVEDAQVSEAHVIAITISKAQCGPVISWRSCGMQKTRYGGGLTRQTRWCGRS
jgi:hypothetical protein